MIDFPANPTLGQPFTAAGVTWTWDGAKWPANGLSVPYLPLTGGTLTGALALAADPTTNLQAATKHYVDVTSAATVPANPNRIDNGDMWVDQHNGGASVVTIVCNSLWPDRWQLVPSKPPS